jgi:cytochrome c oxidase cbb3-type subunit 4
MKLVSHYFESIAGIEIYPIVSFLIFFSFFLIVTYLVNKMDKKEVSDLANLPLENDNDSEAASELNL